ncbi:hypothetical protein D3C75_811510 [compost metagenome]
MLGCFSRRLGNRLRPFGDPVDALIHHPDGVGALAHIPHLAGCSFRYLLDGLGNLLCRLGGLLGAGRQLLGGSRHLHGHILHLGQQIPQRVRHGIEAVAETADFVLAVDLRPVGQIPFTDPRRRSAQLPDRLDNQPDNRHSQCTEHQEGDGQHNQCFVQNRSCLLGLLRFFNNAADFPAGQAVGGVTDPLGAGAVVIGHFPVVGPKHLIHPGACKIGPCLEISMDNSLALLVQEHGEAPLPDSHLLRDGLQIGQLDFGADGARAVPQHLG